MYFVGIDYGGDRTKAVIWDSDANSLIYDSVGEDKEKPIPNLRKKQPQKWAKVISNWLKRLSFSQNVISGIGISLAVPIVQDVVYNETRKFSNLNRVYISDLEKNLSVQCNKPVSVIHDGTAALFGEFAYDQDAQKGSVGILTFGNSIGFGWAREGNPLMHPYTSWVSHIQLRPEAVSEKCIRCNQTGCWRTLYKTLRGDKFNYKIEKLSQLVEITTQGIAALLITLPMNRLYLGGGWVKYFLNPSTITNEQIKDKKPFDILVNGLRERIPFINPEELIRFAQGGDYSGAIGAGWSAKRAYINVERCKVKNLIAI